jgi:O-antigen ligase
MVTNLKAVSACFPIALRGLTVVFFASLPFAYALSVRLFFPLKIAEMAIGLIFLTYLLSVRRPLFTCLKERLQRQPEVRVLGGLLFVVFVSTLVNSWPDYPYPLSYYETRIGYTADSWLKAGYAGLVCGAFLFSSQAFRLFPDKTSRSFLVGGVAASLYAWYLFLGSLLGVSVLLLPGMDPEPQTFPLGNIELIRCGTFKEGNYMGFFLLIASILAIYWGKKKYAFFFLFSILTTLSVMALVCAAFFLNLYLLRKLFRMGQLRKIVGLLALEAVLLVGVASTDSFYALFASRFIYTGEERSLEQVYSVWDRTNSVKISTRMGLENPILGVGPQNYGLHYDQYNQEQELTRAFKSIPNNVYGELFAEVGVPGLALFLLFLVLLHRKAKSDTSGALQAGLLSVALYFLAFPTFTFLQAWVFFGCIASLPDLPQRVKEMPLGEKNWEGRHPVISKA